MEKISISNVIDYYRKTPNSKITFVQSLKKIKEDKLSEGGGDYWIHSLSTVSQVCLSEQRVFITDKIDVLNKKRDDASIKRSKDMFQRNIDILHNFEDFDFSQLKPNCELQILPKPKNRSIIIIEKLPIQVLPNHVFTFKVNSVNKIGAIWFVSKLHGYRREELAYFTEALRLYLQANYLGKYEVDPDFCLSVDVINLECITYADLLDKRVTCQLQETLRFLQNALK